MMEEIFPPGVTWSKPHGGMFLWGILPEGMDAADVLKRANDLAKQIYMVLTDLGYDPRFRPV